jgi:hypothetical protein
MFYDIIEVMKKKLYLYALLVLSFGMAGRAAAQTRAQVDSIKNWTDDFIKDKLAKDPELEIDTVYVDSIDDAQLWGSFGRYNTGKCADGSCTVPSLVVRYLATKVQDQKLTDKINLANGVVPGVYAHESGHRKKMNLVYGAINHSWSLYDNFQRILSDELAQRLAESFNMRCEILKGAVSKNMVRNIADNMPKAKSYNMGYFLWLSENDIQKSISAAEADIMLSALILWMKSTRTDMYFDDAAHMASYYMTAGIGVLSKEKKKLKLMDFDEFITGVFMQSYDGKNYDIFQLAGKEKVDEFMRTIADIMKRYESFIAKRMEHVQSNWGESIGKLNSKYKSDAKKHDLAKLRAEKRMKD